MVLLALAAVPLVTRALGDSYYVSFFTRVLILALAASGLNLILGFAGLVSMGHALYLGVGVYAVGALNSSLGISNGWVQLGVALAVAAALAIPLGLICLRTSGMAFIMITLAFGQMAYYVAVTLKAYGGDDGKSIPARSDFGLLALTDGNVLYGTVFALVLLTLYAKHRLVNSPFGIVLRGIRINERRMGALGYPTLRYKLAAYVISALVCAVAGVLLANLTLYMSPSYLQWNMSGELLIMIVLGGLGTVLGPLYGAVALLCLEELLVSVRWPLPWGLDVLVASHPTAIIGIFVVLAAVLLKTGLAGMLSSRAPIGS